MSKENTTPAEEIKEETAATDAAEEAADEAVAAPEAETEAAEAEAEPAVENAEDEAPADDAAEAETEAQAEGETASEDTEAEEAEDSDSEEAQAEESAEAENEPAPKKPLSFGLGLGIGIAVAAIVAIVFAAIMLIPKFTGPASAVEEYIQAYKDADYEAYFSKDYSVMYNYDDLQERVEQAKQYGDDTVDNLFQMLKWIRYFGIALILFLVVASIVIVAFNIKVTVASRKSEIIIMRYVGASNWYIRWPFCIAGMVMGLFGGIIAVALLYGAYTLFIDQFSSVLVFMSLVRVNTDFFYIFGFMLLFGVLLGSAGSLLSLNVYLKERAKKQ